jgi:hypothetical protein
VPAAQFAALLTAGLQPAGLQPAADAAPDQAPM